MTSNLKLWASDESDMKRSVPSDPPDVRLDQLRKNIHKEQSSLNTYLVLKSADHRYMQL